MDTKLLSEIKNVLLSFPEYWEENALLKSKVIDDLREYRPDLIEKFLGNDMVKNTYAMKVYDTYVFKINEFISMLRYKNYWENSYTKYSNEIGLTSEGKYLKYNSDVVLDFPHKDCVLEGSMTKEDVGKDEVFYHNVLAKEELDIMLSPKVLTNIKKYDKNGVHNISKFTDTDNLILKGNNLVALYTLKERFAGKVKLIYIDPPYNTGSDSFRYNDRFNHSTWLTFMKNRIEITKDLLSEDGSIWIHLDDNEVAHLKVLCDEIFGESNFINLITLKTKTAGVSGSSEGKSLIDATEFILCYAKNKSVFQLNETGIKKPLIPLIEEYKISGKSWKYTTVFKSIGKGEYHSTIKDGSGKDIKIYKHQNFEQSSIGKISKEENISEEEVYKKYIDYICTTENAQTSIRTRVQDATIGEDNLFSIEYYPSSGKNKGKLTTLYFTGPQKRLVSWLKNVCYVEKDTIYKRERISTLWDHLNWNNVNKEGGVNLPGGQKPEELIQLILEMTTDKEDLVLDFFLGSGTTAAVAHKMNRKYIGIEQLNYEGNDSIIRLQGSIEGEQGGISKDVEWNGGGSFIYAELYELNQQFVDEVQQAKSDDELSNLIVGINNKAFLDFKVDIDKLTNDEEKYLSLSLEEKKDILIKALDANQMYLSYSEIDDSQYEIPDYIKQFNHSFYNRGDQS
ncbi:site-specific DNA-methyltransferase [Lentibacillus cibarius]|uniref:Site-specific DNA-methyltransferase n=1 Tax=Lentibacillus cibarius TaxID=2583219 RepID=A0A549YHS3_9BACI|nr:site-specific DNA-methyltransferase [Lentibacillus cibarius]TRM11442.1 site-specific DNA-methyltransferase [Lentibacillus cibarius]